MHYILFKDNTIMIFNGSFHNMLKKIKGNVTKDDITSFGTIDVYKWVCYHKDKTRDIEATMLMRMKLNV